MYWLKSQAPVVIEVGIVLHVTVDGKAASFVSQREKFADAVELDSVVKAVPPELNAVLRK